MLNSVIMMGRLTDNPELRQTPQGANVCSFTIAVERSFARQGEQRQTDFFDVVAWRSQADFVSRFFRKGQMMAVQGRMETRMYEDRNGVRRKAYTIVADSVHFADSKRDSSSGNNFNNYSNYNEQPRHDMAPSMPAPAYTSGNTGDFEEIITDDDLPF
jgi:single-strand DNA-binding protein